jgi:hypothetical protein
MNDAITQSYGDQIIALQDKLDTVLSLQLTDENAAMIGFLVEAIKTHVESLALYRDSEYGL